MGEAHPVFPEASGRTHQHVTLRNAPAAHTDRYVNRGGSRRP
jgi:hypothetical protein